MTFVAFPGWHPERGEFVGKGSHDHKRRCCDPTRLDLPESLRGYACTKSYLDQGPFPAGVTKHLSEELPCSDVFWA